MERRKELMPKLTEARSNGKMAHFVYNRLVIKDRGDRSWDVQLRLLGVLHKDLHVLYRTRVAPNQLYYFSYHRGEIPLYKNSGLIPSKPNFRF
ncbi:hypothetical protein NP493_849g01016 [Ridgeia piscesae]|uniref:Uncharacterized protein n=1 Tax=Ridgeia piscesae TaxID=27915 RepID=A0AAD9NM97_RIDPI|nr:hypothetical protein NP493_849g01016 [Ridgeia piscesae]